MALKDYFNNQRRNYEYKLLKENEARRQALADMIKITEEAGLYEEPEPTFDEINNAIQRREELYFVNDLARTISDQADAIERVREVHKEVDANSSVCGDPDCCGEYIDDWTMCQECYCDYPCKTIKALNGEQENQRKCEVHEWETYGTLGQQCIKCGFTHDFS